MHHQHQIINITHPLLMTKTFLRAEGVMLQLLQHVKIPWRKSNRWWRRWCGHWYWTKTVTVFCATKFVPHDPDSFLSFPNQLRLPMQLKHVSLKKYFKIVLWASYRSWRHQYGKPTLQVSAIFRGAHLCNEIRAVDNNLYLNKTKLVCLIKVV